VVEEGNHQHLEGLKSAREAAESGETTLQTSSHRRQSFAVAPKPFENHAKSYERKSRRKTREDYYTLKETQNAPNQNADEGKYFAKKSGRRKRRGKSGSALMHDFNAQNVAYNRLTVSSTHIDLPHYDISLMILTIPNSSAQPQQSGFLAKAERLRQSRE
jgi:hypothetical protein